MNKIEILKHADDKRDYYNVILKEEN